jgi:antitoxin component of RelBE/YafQ-DinJ toxin-antitoxin module
MTEMATVSAKIEKWKKKEMDELGISPSEVIKKAVDDVILQRKREKAAEGISEIVPLLRKVSEESWVKAIRETREER